MSNRTFLIGLWVVSLCTHFLFSYFFFKTERDFFVPNDSGQYHAIARRIVQGEGVSCKDGAPSFYRVPGYAFFLSLCYKLFNKNIKCTIWLQIFLASLIPLLTFFLSLALFPGYIVTAKISSLCMAFGLGFLVHASLLMSEVLFILFFLLFAILFFARTYWFFAGLFLGCASLVRPVDHYILPLCIVLLCCAEIERSYRIRSIIYFCLGWFLAVFPWLLRNYVLTGMLLFHTMPGYHFLNYFAVEVKSKAAHAAHHQVKRMLLKQWQYAIQQKEKMHGASLDDIKKGALAQDIALGVFKKYPLITLQCAVGNVLKTLCGLHAGFFTYRFSQDPYVYTSHTTIWDKIKRYLFPQIQSPFIKGIMYVEYLLTAFMLLGFFLYTILSWWRRYRLDILFSLLPMLGLFVGLTFGSGIARLRMPCEPFFIICSVQCMLLCLQKKGWYGVKRT